MSSTEKALEQLNKIVKAFSTKEFPNFVSKAYIESIGKPMERWSFNNQLLVFLYGTDDARTYNQWNKVGRQVKKGSKAIYILAPLKVKRKKIDDNSNENEDMVLVGFRGLPVFKYEDTEGDQLDPPKKRELPPLHHIAEKWGVTIKYDTSRVGEYGSFNQYADVIRLCTEDPVTFFHELTHKAHSKFETLKPGQDPEQEAIAQLTACVLGNIYGYDAMDYSWHYIASYSEEKTPDAVGKMCIKVLNKVQKILQMILDDTAEQVAVQVPTKAKQ